MAICLFVLMGVMSFVLKTNDIKPERIKLYVQKIVGDKEVTGLSYKHALTLYNKCILRFNKDTLFYLSDTLFIKRINSRKASSDSIRKITNFNKIPSFIKVNRRINYFEISFREKSSLTSLQLFFIKNVYYFEHEGYFFQLKPKQ
jgi:hypothetical protein